MNEAELPVEVTESLRTEAVHTGLEGLKLVHVCLEPPGLAKQDCRNTRGIWLLFQDPSNPERMEVVWIASDPEGNDNGSLHILANEDGKNDWIIPPGKL